MNRGSFGKRHLKAGCLDSASPNKEAPASRGRSLGSRRLRHRFTASRHLGQQTTTRSKTGNHPPAWRILPFVDETGESSSESLRPCSPGRGLIRKVFPAQRWRRQDLVNRLNRTPYGPKRASVRGATQFAASIPMSSRRIHRGCNGFVPVTVNDGLGAIAECDLPSQSRRTDQEEQTRLARPIASERSVLRGWRRRRAAFRSGNGHEVAPPRSPLYWSAAYSTRHARRALNPGAGDAIDEAAFSRQCRNKPRPLIRIQACRGTPRTALCGHPSAVDTHAGRLRRLRSLSHTRSDCRHRQR